jgi:hypothetical protein
LSKSAEGIVEKAATYTGRVQIADAMGEIYFVLLTEMGLDVWPNREFKLRGPGLTIYDQTDENGEFRYSPAEFGEYELEVGDAVFGIPAVAENSSPYRVHVPYVLLPDQYEWEELTEEDEWEESIEEESEEN